MRLTAAGSLCAVLATIGIAATPGREVQSPAGGLVTLYKHDPLARNVSFETGSYGGVFQDHMVKNHQSDLDFGHYYANEFSVGIEGGSIGAIVDLGSPKDLQARYGYQETVGGGQGFASIRLEKGKLVVLDDYQAQTTQPLHEAAALFGHLQSCAHAPIHANHVYLVRLGDRDDAQFERLVKLLVVRYEPGVSVTLRWHRIETAGAS